MATKQAEREVVAKSPLGDDVLLFQHMTGTEALGRPFQFDLELLSEDQNVALEDVLGKLVTVSVKLPAGGERHFNGYVTAFAFVGQSGRYAAYRATLRPWLWFLTRTADCRIFQEKTVPDIVKEIFREHGFTDFDDKMSGTYRQWEYCVQYRETDFNFVSRLMEQEGISYYFTHDDGKHTLVLADADSSRGKTPDYETIPFYPPDTHDRRIRDHIFDWSIHHEVQPGAFALNDFDFETPKKNLKANLSKPNPHDLADYEIYDYPGEYGTPDDGNAYSRVRLEELHARYQIAQGAGNARGIAVGCLFELGGYPREDQNREYLVTSVIHDVTSDEYVGGGGGGDVPAYRCSFTAIDSRVPFRSERLTPKPVVQGPQTAIIVGKSGEEIWTDKHGRVKVQFHWDRYGKSDEKSSCWIRVAQLWAGKSWGGIMIPRIGQEVVVEFLEGDPDQPLITGRVYNGDNMPPYGLPDNKTQSGIKSRSSKGGGAANYNELRFEDKKGEEKITFHAEKDYDQTVENDKTVKVDGKHTETIKKDTEITVTEGNVDVKVEKGNVTFAVASGTLERTVKSDVTDKFQANHTADVSQTFSLKAQSVKVEGLMDIELKVGSNSVKIDNTGVTIKGMMVKVQGDMQTEVKAGAMVSVKGGIVMIN